MTDAIYLDFPTTKVSGCSILREDGTCIPVLNSRQAEARCREAFLHEVGHDVNDDFGKEDVQAVEASAH